MTQRVDGVDRALARWRRVQIETAILRNVTRLAATAPAPSRVAREVPDRTQLLGAPVITLKTPAWPREDWAQPQRRRIRPSC